MPAFRVSGATGQAPTTSYFGYVPDKYTMLLPAYMGLKDSVGDTAYHQNIAANLLNIFIPWNLSFGGGANTPTASFTDFITAPDGTTNTMQRLAETTANTKHFAQAGCINVGPIGGVLRFAGLCEYAGRRIILDLNNGSVSFSAGVPIGGTGCKAIFDLAGAQVGVAAATYGAQASQWRAVGQGIIPYGNGVYLCYMDAFVDNRTITAVADIGQSSVNVYATVYLDNGTGTNIESSTYAGDGVSGVYGWKMNLMPVTAYRISQSVFFDDFLDTSSIDITNSYAPGFKWYSGGGWHFGQGGTAQESVFGIQYTVSGSCVNLLPNSQSVNGYNNGVTLRTAAPIPGNGTVQNAPTVGTAWAPPFMIEFREKFDYSLDLAPSQRNAVATWGWSLEFVNGMIQQTTHGDGTFNNPPIGLPGINGSLMGYEYDIVENQTGSGSAAGYRVGSTYLHYEQGGISSTRPGGDFIGGLITYITPGSLQAPQWISGNAYGFGPHEVVYHIPDATFYNVTTGHTSSGANEPPSADWSTTLTGPIVPTFFDMDQFHTYTFMRLPYLPGKGVVNNTDTNTNTTNPGMILCFFDGILANVNPCFAPWSNLTSPPVCVTDYQHYLINHGGAWNTGGTSTFRIDWVRVSQ